MAAKGVFQNSYALAGFFAVAAGAPRAQRASLPRSVFGSPGKGTLLHRTAAAFTSRGIPDDFAVLCQLIAPCRPSMRFDGQVMTQMARNLTDAFDGYLKGMRFFVCDHDPLYTAAFRQVLKDAGIKVIQTRIGCPQQNGYAESFVATVQRECLNHLTLFGEKSLRRATTEYMEHFHQERNHQGLDNEIPFPKSCRSGLNTGLIVKSERLGGLLKYYHRETAKEGQEAA